MSAHPTTAGEISELSGTRAPALSVLMPVLGPHPQYLPQAVQSVLGQTFSDFELIITEDPTGGPTAEAVLDKLGDARIVYQPNPKRTRLIQQRNQGLATARAPLVALVDSDDVCEPERFRKQFEFLQAHPEVSVLSSQLTIIDASGQIVGQRSYPTQHEQLVRALPRYNPIAQPAVMFRKAAILEVGGYSYEAYNVNSDYDLWCKLALAGARFAVLDEALVRYRIHPAALKSSKLRDVIRATLDIKQRYFGESMDFGARARLKLETALLALPPRLVLELFMLKEYRSRGARRQGAR